MKLHLIAGARPNFIKIAPLWRGLRGHGGIHASFIHMAQHRDDHMTSRIWRELGLADPDHILEWQASGGHDPCAQMMTRYAEVCHADRPDAVLVVGDVTASLAAAMIASEMKIPLIHLEAGLRCFDRSMPEEINRIRIAGIADLHLTPSPDADANLLAEGIAPERIKRVGNIMIDTLIMMGNAIRREKTCHQLGLDKRCYSVVTLHRPGNVDMPERLLRICQALGDIAQDIPVCLPLHPRTEQQLIRTGTIRILEQAGVRLLPPLGYVGFGSLMRDAGLVITDSGGVQEETSWLGIPCLTLRPSTERPVTITQGTNRLIMVEDLVKVATDHALSWGDQERRACQIPFWDGETTTRVIAELDRFRRA